MHAGSICTRHFVLGCGIYLNTFLMCFKVQEPIQICWPQDWAEFLSCQGLPFHTLIQVADVSVCTAKQEGPETSVTHQCFSILAFVTLSFHSDSRSVQNTGERCKAHWGAGTPSRNTIHLLTLVHTPFFGASLLESGELNTWTCHGWA